MPSLHIYRFAIDGVIVIALITILSYQYRNKEYNNFTTVSKELQILSINEIQQNELHTVVRKLTETGKGILAADESIDTIGKRFAKIGIENNEENRRNYRYALFTTPNISMYISGIILHEETFHQRDNNGKRFVDIIRKEGILAGIKLDKGLKQPDGSPSEYITLGLDKLAEKAVFYKEGGCQFAKWRCVYGISKVTPSRKILKENAKTLAQYAVISQQAGLVPIIEPEVLSDGTHNIEETERITEEVLAEVYKALHDYGVYLEGTILKPNMVVPGSDNPQKVNHDRIANETLRALMRTVPAAVPGIVFLSGGQPEIDATRNLNEINKTPFNKPWKLSFSYGRALQTSALRAWKTDGQRAAQMAFLHRAKLNSLAAKGQYTDELE